MSRWHKIVGVLALAIAGCARQGPVGKVTSVADDDPRMNAAMEKAKSSVQLFVAALKSPEPGQTGFAIKTSFTDGDHTEHMWLSPVIFDGAVFTGTVSNVPEKVKSVSLGQKVSVAADKISDWMFVDNRKLVGGETIRVLRDALTPEQRADFDEGVPFTVD